MLVHRAGAKALAGYPEVAIPPLRELVEAYAAVAGPVRPTAVAAVALNTAGLDDAGARAAVRAAEDATGLVADDLVRFGPTRLLDAVLAALAAG